MSADSISKQVLEKFWAKVLFFQEQSKGTTLHYRGVYSKLKIHTEGNKLKFSWYSDRPHSLIHITHFSLSRCGLGKGMKYTPFCSLSGYRLSGLHAPQAHRLTMFFFFYTNNKNPPLNCYIMPPPCCFQWSCPSRCPSIVEAGMSLAHLRSKGGA